MSLNCHVPPSLSPEILTAVQNGHITNRRTLNPDIRFESNEETRAHGGRTAERDVLIAIPGESLQASNRTRGRLVRGESSAGTSGKLAGTKPPQDPNTSSSRSFRCGFRNPIEIYDVPSNALQNLHIKFTRLHNRTLLL